jgi:predicted dehydrogenase
MKRIRVGVVGHGYFGTFHAKHYAGHPDAELVLIADPGEKAGEDIRAAYGDIRVGDHTDLIGKIDAASIAAPTALHHKITSDLIEAGISVLVEKPLCESANGARQLAELAERRGVRLHVGHIERFSATYRRLKESLRAPPLQIECWRHTPWRGRILDVDVVLDLMIHDLDLALDLVGSEPVDVSASGVSMMGHGLDSVLAQVGFANGCVAHFSASRVAPTVSRIVKVTEADRSLSADLMTGRLGAFSSEDSAVHDAEIAHVDALRAEIDAFLGAVAGKGDGDAVDGRQAWRALALADRIRQQAAERS